MSSSVTSIVLVGVLFYGRASRGGSLLATTFVLVVLISY